MRREEYCKRALAHEKSKSELCREYNISRPTGYKWLKRYQAKEPMFDRSREPHTRPQRTDAVMESAIVELRKKYPAIGAVKLHRMMQNEGVTDIPCAKTFNNIFHRHGLITREASQASTPCQRFEKQEPNEMWQADYKGHFPLKDGKRCHPLTILDDHSRFNICCEAQLTETYAEIRPVMIRLFEEYGLPFSFLCDNGTPWGNPQSTGFTRFEVELMELGVLTLHGRIRHPQTQGKEESFNHSLKRECLAYKTISDKNEAQRVFAEYRDFYNNVRPHMALGLDVPASRYKASPRKMPTVIEDWEYSSEYKLCKVKESGYISFRGQGYYLSEAFAGKVIAVRESHIPGQVTLVFRQFRIGRIDPEARVFTLKRIYLLEGDPRL